jgi:hypothetical protein
MTNRDKEKRDGILALLEAVSDYDQTASEAKESLEADGVDVSTFLARVQQSVDAKKKEGRLAWQREAQAKRERFASTQEDLLPFANLNRSELEAAVAAGERAVFMKFQENTDDDLRRILADRARLAELKKK